jgi:hypothetical protein
MVVAEERCGGTFLRDQVVIFFSFQNFPIFVKNEKIVQRTKKLKQVQLP